MEYEVLENEAVEEAVDSVNISHDVVASIAGLAASEIEGVASMAGNINNEIVGKLGIKNMSKGVKITITDNQVNAELFINIRYGYSIPKTAAKVQERVRNSVESMTGLAVAEVNVHVVGIIVG